MRYNSGDSNQGVNEARDAIESTIEVCRKGCNEGCGREDKIARRMKRWMQQ